MANVFGYSHLSIYAGTALDESRRSAMGGWPLPVPWSRSADDVHEYETPSSQSLPVRRVASADSVTSFPFRDLNTGPSADLDLGDQRGLLSPRPQRSLKRITRFPLIQWITALHTLIAQSLAAPLTEAEEGQGAPTDSDEFSEPQQANLGQTRRIAKRTLAAIVLVPCFQLALNKRESLRLVLKSGATWTCNSVFRNRSVSTLLMEVYATLKIGGRLQQALRQHRLNRQNGTLAKVNSLEGHGNLPLIRSENLISHWFDDPQIILATSLIQPLLQPQLEHLDALLCAYWACARNPGLRVLQAVQSMMESLRHLLRPGLGGAEALLTRAFALLLCRVLRCHPHNDHLHFALQESSIGVLLTQGLLVFAAPDDDANGFNASSVRSFEEMEKELKRIVNHLLSRI